MKNFKKKILFLLLGSFLFSCGQRSNKSKMADLLTEFLLSLAPSSFKLVKKTADFYSLELSFKEEFKPELHHKLKSIGCLGDVLIFQKYNETSQTYEDLNEDCLSLPLNDLLINSEARDKEGKKIFSYSLSLNKNDPSYPNTLKTVEASPLDPNNYDEAYQLKFDLKKLVAGTTHDVEEINQLELVAQFQTLPKIESTTSEARTLHLLFKKHENAKAFAEKINSLTADELLNCEPEATMQALDAKGQCLGEVKILATLDHPLEGKKLSLQESSDLYIHKLNFNHVQDSDALQFSISQDYLLTWDESPTGADGGKGWLVAAAPAGGADKGADEGADASYGGTCTNGVLIALAKRTQDNHCGSCHAGHYLKDKSCEACGAGKFKAGTNNALFCTSVRTCDAGTAETSPPTVSSDRECSGDCGPGFGKVGTSCVTCNAGSYPNTYSATTGTSSCNDHKACIAGQYQTQAPTATSDRGCADKQCICANGAGAAGSDCPNDGKDRCASCNPGHGLNSNGTSCESCQTAKYRLKSDAECEDVDSSGIRIYKLPPSLPSLSSFGYNLSSSYLLGICQGDCDSDSNCQPGLRCHSQDHKSTIPGCAGTPEEAMDYCVEKYYLCEAGTYSTGGQSTCLPKKEVSSCAAGEYLVYTSDKSRDTVCQSELLLQSFESGSSNTTSSNTWQKINVIEATKMSAVSFHLWTDAENQIEIKVYDADQKPNDLTPDTKFKDLTAIATSQRQVLVVNKIFSWIKFFFPTDVSLEANKNYYLHVKQVSALGRNRIQFYSHPNPSNSQVKEGGTGGIHVKLNHRIYVRSP